MARRMVAFGDVSASEIQTFGPHLPVWPEIDVVFDGAFNRSIGKYRGRIETLGDGRAVCLAPDTDHDLVRIFVDDDQEGQLLGPGMLIRMDGAKKLSVAPATGYPATRLLQYSGYGTFGRAQQPAGYNVRVDLDIDHQRLRNMGPSPVTFYQWTGAGWGAAQQAAPGNFFARRLDWNAATERTCDYSFDKIVNVGDLIRAGSIRQVSGDLYDSPLYTSGFAKDSNGNPGDPTDGTLLQYQSGVQMPIDGRWDGRCLLLVWDGEDPPCDYSPRLAPERYVLFPQVAVAQEAVVGKPNTPIVTVPALNVASVQFTFRTAAAAGFPLDVALGSPLPEYEFIDAAAAVTSDVAQALAAGGGVAQAVLPNIHQLVQVVAGGNGGASILGAGAALTLRRAFIG